MAKMLSFGIDPEIKKRKVVRTHGYWIYYDDDTRDPSVKMFLLNKSATEKLRA